MTIWMRVPGYDCYEVSDEGTVRKRINLTHPERRQFHLMAQEKDKDGYFRVCLQKKHIHVHRVVYSAFCGDLVNGLVVCHLDGNRQNNKPSNLDQVTQKENISHKRLHGTWQSGEKHPRALLSNEQARLIALEVERAPKSRAGRLSRGEAQRIAKQIDVSVGLVHSISRARRSYRNELHTGL